MYEKCSTNNINAPNLADYTVDNSERRPFEGTYTIDSLSHTRTHTHARTHTPRTHTTRMHARTHAHTH